MKLRASVYIFLFLAAFSPALSSRASGAVLSVTAPAVNEGSTATIDWALDGYDYPYEEKFGAGVLTYSGGGTTMFNENYASSYTSGTFTETFGDDGVFSRTISGSVYYKRYYIPNGLLDISGIHHPSETFSITVLNVAPTISIADDTTVGQDVLFPFWATAADPGTSDVLTYNWDLDGNGVYDDYTGASGQWSYQETGIHVLGVRVEDGDGGVATGSFEVTVVPLPGAVVLGILGVAALSLARRFAGA